ncbi:BZ3500_MvSof-1268-A1-R1_Chr1-3g02435 [Microbotryum saponariae]|uniref:BZ3500_MvSof-1268-A1-R1_Chr1-3g02435 protein n=1 Tax=Microbotryum saponariae TaxID=289078 RepID=A0A2X0KC98_9BASI|nr:BZ3500_MvSof-1268-A1-R1_Chr1-3g02435 [Microbotryum saponariae]SCZ96222.1 BZ3501_MvSof-1269-A2-R1_Chr1-3g02038 [Microbotryum saponariae]
MPRSGASTPRSTPSTTRQTTFTHPNNGGTGHSTPTETTSLLDSEEGTVRASRRTYRSEGIGGGGPVTFEGLEDEEDGSDFPTLHAGLSGREGGGGYGTSGGGSHGQGRTAAFATLPTKLARSASVARKVERRERRKTQWKAWSNRARYYVPVLAWLPDYSFKTFTGDVTAAFTMTSLIVPQSMSYSSNLVNSDPVSGLLGASIPPMIYSVLGTCRQLSVGPEAALSLIMGESISKIIDAETHAHGGMSNSAKMQLTFTITSVIVFQAGLITFALGMLRLGFIDAVLSRALLRGFITAVGIVIFVAQLIPILGLERHTKYGADTTLSKLMLVIKHMDKAHRLTLIVSCVALLVLVSAKSFKARLAKRRGYGFLAYVPEVLVVVILSTVFSATFDWQAKGLSVLGKVSIGDVRILLPFSSILARKYSSQCIGTASVLAILGFLDSIVGAKDSAAKFDYPISSVLTSNNIVSGSRCQLTFSASLNAVRPNRELVAIGAANLVASFVSGALPGYGSITRSRLAGATGATTQMTSLLTGVFVLLVSFFLLGFLYALPKCILAVIICVVVFSILAEAPHDVMFFWRMRAWLDLSLMAMTFFLSLFISVEIGIIVSVAFSMLLCIKHSSAMRIKILGRVPGTSFYEPLEDDDDDGLFPSEEIPGILIVRFRDASLTFANAGALKERLRRLERYGQGRHHPSETPSRAEASVIIFHLVDVEDIDASALQLIYELVEAYVSRSVLVYWTQIQPIPLARLRKAGVLEMSGGEAHVQPNVQMALQVLEQSVISAQTF